MVRTSVDLDDEKVNELIAIAELGQHPLVAVICAALETYVAQRKWTIEIDVFGLWMNRKIDGLTWTQELRSDR